MTDPALVIVEDDDDLREALCDTVHVAGISVVGVADGASALQLMEDREPRLVLSDVKMKPMDGYCLLGEVQRRHPRVPVVLMTAFGNIEQAVRAMQGGAVDYLVKPFEADVLLEAVTRYVRKADAREDNVIAADRASKRLLSLAGKVAASEATVLITGDSGTGKEVIARYIHDCSPRRDHAFVAVNCAAIPDTMLEATLFGHQKGAFTGAYQSSAGKFERAQGGTLLLDEISEMDLGLQAKLLRVLQEREVERLGGSRVIELDVRVLATSNRSLPSEVKAGRFREDLYYRVNVFPLHIPPLRDRPGDILTLARYFLERHARSTGQAIPRLEEAAAQWLCSYRWPGNVRELENLMHRALILSKEHEIRLDDLHTEFDPGETENDTQPRPANDVSVSLDNYLKSLEEARIVDTLKSVNGSREEAARRLGISARTLRYKLAKMREEGVSSSTI